MNNKLKVNQKVWVFNPDGRYKKIHEAVISGIFGDYFYLNNNFNEKFDIETLKGCPKEIEKIQVFLSENDINILKSELTESELVK